MPRAGDAFLNGALPTTHSPLERLNFQGAATKIDPLAIIAQWTQFFEDFGLQIISDLTGVDLTTLKAFLDALSPENLIKFFIGIIPHLLTGVNIGALTSIPPNLTPLGTFPAGSINANPFWSVDTTSHSGDGSGSAKVVADGTFKALRSGSSPGDRIVVSVGQTFSSSVFVSHTGYSGSGAPILLQVVPFTGEVAGDPVTLITTPATGDPGGAEVLAAYSPASPNLAWPGYELGGNYTVPSGVTSIQTRIFVTSDALAGTFWFDDASATQPGLLRQEWIDGLPDALQALVSRFQLTIDAMLSALTKVPVVGGTLEDLFQMLGLIPPDNVLGAAGPGTMFDSIFGVIDAFLSGLVGAPGSTGGSLADATNAAGQVASDAALGGFAWQIVNMLNNTPVARGFLASGRANYEWPSANTFLSTTQSAALSVSFGLQQAMPIGVISWYGYGTASLTAFYINIRKVNLSTGVRDLVHHSGNIVGNLEPGSSATDAQFMFYEIPTPLAGEATDYYYVEFVPVGGTHHIRGISSTDTINDHPTAAVPCYGTVVDYSSSPNIPSSSLAKATAGPNVAWVEFAPALGDVADHREPQIWTFDFDGETIPIPSWANRVDAIPLGKGGNGHAGTLPTFNGEAGQPGKFAPVTWARDTDFTDGDLVTFNVLSDGSAKLSIPSHDTTAASGVDGAGAKFNLTPIGQGPGILDYNGQKYTGGVDQKAGGGAGQNPGGAGNGGNGLFFQAGGLGGKAAGWVCFRQIEVVSEQTEGDTTPPPPPGVVVDSATFSTIIVHATGGMDV